MASSNDDHPPAPAADPDRVEPARAADTGKTVDMLARYRDGDPDAFHAVVGEYEARLIRFFYRLCWDRGRAEDFTQELFLKLLRGARRYKPQGRLSTFIFRVATNLWIDYYRSNKTRSRFYSLDQVMLTGEPVIKTKRDVAGPGDRLILDEEKQRLRDAIESLTEPHRLVLELAIYQELPYAQISTVLEIPVGTVKSRMHNCVRALRAHMAEQKVKPNQDEADQASFRFRRRAGGTAG